MKKVALWGLGEGKSIFHLRGGGDIGDPEGIWKSLKGHKVALCDRLACKLINMIKASSLMMHLTFVIAHAAEEIVFEVATHVVQ